MVSFQGVYMVLGKLWPQKKPVGQPNGSGSAAPPKWPKHFGLGPWRNYSSLPRCIAIRLLHSGELAIAMEHRPNWRYERPIENGDFRTSHVSLPQRRPLVLVISCDLDGWPISFHNLAFILPTSRFYRFIEDVSLKHNRNSLQRIDFVWFCAKFQMGRVEVPPNKWNVKVVSSSKKDFSFSYWILNGSIFLCLIFRAVTWTDDVLGQSS